MLHSSQSLGPYRILAPLGRGAMGEVYRARDARLNRDVAVKLLPREFLSDPDRLGRFEREARAAAALNHPNILSVYDIGTQDGVPYFVSELLTGETLRARLDRGSLAIHEATDYGKQVANGLAAAHATGIVHRDVKPENLFITSDGRIKILDFGLAKATMSDEGGDAQDETRAATTEAGVILGTVPYMSPEQVRGAALDHRSDIFAFGSVLYEMLTGRMAFAAPTAAETISTILTKDPFERPDGMSDGLPPALVQIVRHCLEKDPQARFQSARDIAFGLEVLSGPSEPVGASDGQRASRGRAWTLVGVGVALLIALAMGLSRLGVGPQSNRTIKTEAVKSILALPFANLSGNAEDEYFSDGMTDSLITDLAKVDSLTVIARSAAFRYKDQAVDARKAGQELGARYVLQGSVQRSGPRVRVNAQLVEVASGYQIWAERFEEDTKDLFMLQDQMSSRIVETLQLKLSPPMVQRQVRRPKTNEQAYDAYLQGLYYRHKPGEGNIQRALPFFEKATTLDPRFALAQAALGSAYTQYFFYIDADRRWEQKAFLAIEKSLALDPELAEGYLARGQLAWSLPNGFPHEQAVKDLQKALAINPGLAEAHRELGKIYMHIGLLEKSITENTAALSFDPSDTAAKRRRIGAYMYGRDCATALELSERDLPDDHLRAWALTCLGKQREALQQLSTQSVLPDNDASFLAVLLARSGELDAARKQIARLRVEADNVAGLSDLHHMQYNIGTAYALMGETRLAVTWLKKASREGLPCYPLYEKDPHLDSLRQDPEFATFMQQLEAQARRFQSTL
jgi:eukaryotic-like serine/threonine-protein kinase